MTHYPEHEKMAKVREELDTIGEFLEWLPTTGKLICDPPEPSTGTYWTKPYYTPSNSSSIPQLLAKYFGIDEKVLEDEKRAMLKEFTTSSTEEEDGEDICIADLMKGQESLESDFLFASYDDHKGPMNGDPIPMSSLRVGTIILPPFGYEDYGTPQFHNHLFVTRGNGVQGEVYLTGDPIHHCGEVGPFQESKLVRYTPTTDK